MHLEGKAYSTTKEVLARADGWTAYKIGRQAARYGHHQLASDIFGNIATKVSEKNDMTEFVDYQKSDSTYCFQVAQIKDLLSLSKDV